MGSRMAEYDNGPNHYDNGGGISPPFGTGFSNPYGNISATTTSHYDNAPRPLSNPYDNSDVIEIRRK